MFGTDFVLLFIYTLKGDHLILFISEHVYLLKRTSTIYINRVMIFWVQAILHPYNVLCVCDLSAIRIYIKITQL